MSRQLRSAALTIVQLAVVLAPPLAFASPGGGPLVGFGTTILNFLTGPLAYVVVGLGIAIAAISLVFGSRDGLLKGFMVLLGGGLLFGAHAVAQFIQSSAGQ